MQRTNFLTFVAVGPTVPWSAADRSFVRYNETLSGANPTVKICEQFIPAPVTVLTVALSPVVRLRVSWSEQGAKASGRLRALASSAPSAAALGTLLSLISRVALLAGYFTNAALGQANRRPSTFEAVRRTTLSNITAFGVTSAPHNGGCLPNPLHHWRTT